MSTRPYVRAATRTRRVLARVLAMALVVSGSGVFVAVAAIPAQAGVTAAFNQVFSASTTGGIQIRGNTVSTCQDAATACAAGRATLNVNDNSFFMTYADVDSDATTFDSSSATVNVPSGGSVLFAALVWGGNTTAGASLTSAAYGTGTGANAPTPASAGQVKFMVPGAATYATVTSTRTSFLSGSTGPYQGYANVTSQVQAAGNGSYTVANVQTATGENIHGGWALVIAYSNPTDPPRNLTIFSGFGTVGAGDIVDFTVSGFNTPPAGAVKTTLGMVSYEGDAASTGDQLLLGSSVATLQNVVDTLHPVGNSQTSVISDNGVDSSTRNPKYKNQLGFDAATFNVNSFLANGSTSAAIRMTSAASTGETYYPGVVTFATDLYSPDLTATKTVALIAKGAGNTLSGIVEPGDTLRYTVNASNSGQDASLLTVLTDTIPAGTTYVPGSLTSGGTALTDATGDDIGSYNAATQKLTINAGTSATATTGGRVAVGASIPPVTFNVTVNSNIADGASIANTASLAYSGEQTGQAVTGASNAVTSPAVRHHSALAITKTADIPLVQRGAATPVTYTLTATNTGPYDEPAATVTDTLPAGAVVVSATTSAGTCTTPAGKVVCNLGALVNGGTATITVKVTLDAAADPATDTATIAGTNVDSTPADNTASKSTAVNTAPVAVADTATTSGGSATVNVLANDSDADGNTLTVSPGATTPTKGTIVVNADKTITYTALAGTAGTDTFSYLISDGRGGTATALVTITIPDAPPVANPDAATTLPLQAVTVPVLANDTDPNIPTTSQTLSVSAVTQPAGSKGTVTTNGSTVTFTPSGTFLKGVATFTYTVSDGVGGTAVGTVTVTIPNVGPVAAADTAVTPYLTPVTVDVLANDVDDNGDPLSVVSVTSPAHGTASVVAGKVVYSPAVGWSGVDSMTYTMTDGTAQSSASLTVTTGNGAPTAGSFSATVNGAVATTLDVLSHASDPNGDPLSVTGAGPASHGTVTVNASGGVVYTPDATYAGTDSFAYTVDDGHGGTASGTVTLTVRNQAPKAHDDTATVPVNGSVDIPVLTNDTDGNNDTLTVSSVTAPANGTATIRPDGTVRYVPGSFYLGTDSFSYTVDDGHGGTDTATVSVTVANQPPVAADDTAVASGHAGSPVSIDVLANDSDPNGDPLTIATVSVPSHGTAAVVSGKVVYTPSATYVGPDSFTYTISDGRGGTSGATVTVDVQNRDPVAHPDTVAVSTGMPATVDVLANDTDPDAETLSLLSVDATSAHGGSVTVVGGVVHYVSANSFTGTDTFSYVVTDPRGGTDTGTVTVHVTNADPVAGNRTATTATDTPVTLDLLSGVTDSDGQPLSIVSAGPASHGTVTLDPSGHATYTPDPGYSGPDSYSYVASDGQGGSDTATVSVTVSDAAPVAVDDTASVGYDVPLTVDVLANDTDANIPGTTQVLSLTSATLVGGSATVTLVPGGVHVDPTAGFAGDVVVHYVVSDGAGGNATGTLTVHVAIPPVTAVDDSASTTVNTPVDIDVLANDDSGEVGVDPTITSVTSPAHGVVTIVGGHLHYVPPAGYAGTVTFDYSITNPLGATDTATVTLTVGNASPVAVDDTASTAYATPVTVDVLANDTDPNIPGTSQTLSIQSATVTGGQATLTTGGQLTVTPDAGFAGDVVVQYVVSDGAGGTDTGHLTVHVAIPVAVAADDTATTAFGAPVNVDVLANDDSGEAGVDPTIASVTAPLGADSAVHGAVSIIGGLLRYVPPPTFSGTVTFDYTITNPLGGSASATVTLTVGNASPVAVDDTTSTPYDTTVDVAVTANDTDPNIPGTSQVLTVSSAHLVSGSATVTVTPGGDVEVDPDAAFAGDVVVSYVVSDGAGGTDTGQLTVHVALPVAHAVDDSAMTDPGVAVTVDVLANDDSGEVGVTPTLGAISAPLDSLSLVRGTVSAVPGGVLYTPPSGFSGVVTFTYGISNPLGGTDTGTVTVVVGNVPPTAVDDVAGTTYATPVVVDVLANDTDPNIPGSTQTLSVTSASLVSGHGTVTIGSDNSIKVKPATGFAGDIVVAYVVSDGAGGTANGTLTVHVSPPVPTAVRDHAVTPYETAVLLDVLSNDHSGLTGAAARIVTGSVTSPREVSSAGHGTLRASTGKVEGSVSVVGGKLRYSPPSGFAGVVSFGYTIANPLGGLASTTVTVTVKAQVVEQLAEVVTITADKDAVTLDPSGEVTGHGTLSIVSFTQPANGATVKVVDGKLVVLRQSGFVGTVPFTYVVLGADHTLVTVTVNVHVLAKSVQGGGHETTGSGSSPGTSSGGGILPHTGAEVGLVSIAGLVLVSLGTIAIWLAAFRRRREDEPTS